MPLYSIRGTDLQCTIPDNDAEAYNRVDCVLFTTLIEQYHKNGPITLNCNDMLTWTKVSAVIDSLWTLNPGCGHGGIIEKYEPRLVKG